MKGRKPSHTNVIPMREDDGLSLAERAAAESERLKPEGLTEDEEWLWGDIAPELFKVGRLSPRYVHTVHEYCAALARLRFYRLDLQTGGETYSTKTRNGYQQKSRPEVGQYNEAHRQWRALANDLGLNPQAERALSTAIPDLFDDEYAT